VRILLALLAGAFAFGCSKESPDRAGAPAAPGPGKLSVQSVRAPRSGTVKVDGSSTVFPITEAVAEEFQRATRGARVIVGISGTGGGFKKFCNGEIDVSDASRPIRPVEVELCAKNGVRYIELPIAYDGLAVVVSHRNNWAKNITTEELKRIWEPEAQGRIMKWSDVRVGWPERPLRLYGPGVDSGTYDYFTEAIVMREHASRGDFTSSEDDNVIAQGVASDPAALGYFGFAYYEQNKNKLRVLAVDDGKAENGAGPIELSVESVRSGAYQPLSRPIFIYVAERALDRTDVLEFTKFYLTHAASLSREVGYIPLPERAYVLARGRVDNRLTGSVFGGKGSQVGVSLDALLAKEGG
jgi:phosphate transport system substrate-binding protein